MVALQEALDELSGWLTLDTLLDLARRSSETYKDLAKTSTEHFLVTPVTALPTGKEQGKFLAIDVGGSTLAINDSRMPTGLSSVASIRAGPSGII
jgi:hexokinase